MAAVFSSVVGFAPALRGAFVYDDEPIIASNPLVTEPGAWYRFWRAPYWPPAKSSDKLYRPVTVLSFRLNTVLAPGDAPDPLAFHLVNLLLHALTSAGVVVLACRVFNRSAAGWVAGILFAVHPLHTEAVVTACGRSELLAACFGVWLLARYVRSDRPCSIRFHAVNALLLAAAIMSKEQAVLLWPVLLVIDLARRQSIPRAARATRRRWLNETIGPAHLGFILALTCFFLLRYWLFGWSYRLPADRVRAWESPMAHAGLVEHLLTPLRLLWLSVELLVRPGRLCPIWSVTALSPASRPASDVIAGAGVLILLLLAAWRLRRRAPTIGAMLIGLLILLAMPTHALSLAHWMFAERWLYLPSVLAAILVGVAAARLPRVVLLAAMPLVTVWFGAASWEYTKAFRSNDAMFHEVVRRQPDNFQGWRCLSAYLVNAGRYHEAIDAAEYMVARFDDVRDPYLILMKAHVELGDGRQAIEDYEHYVSLSVDTFPGMLLELYDRAQALVEKRASTQADP
jgi:hypothetical protein